jgi:parallel beta-helix repeat protein
VQHNSDKHGSFKADIAVILPEDYGFGFRSFDDSVWQYHQADNWTRKLYTDIANLANQNDSRIDLMYGDQEFQSLIQTKYSRILYWPNDFRANNNYPAININNNLGYSTVQDAISSYATYEGHMILIKPGTYQENIVITKPVSLVSQNKDSTIIEGTGTGNLSVLTIACDNVTLTGFIIQNDGNNSALTGTGILLENAHNCTITTNMIRHNHDGLVLDNSSGNMLKSNELSDNAHNLILVNAPNNNIDTTNTINGKPFTIK